MNRLAPLSRSPARKPARKPAQAPSRAPSRSQRGFSLLEVLVAFAILALSLGVLLQVFSQAMNGTALSEGYSRAVTLAEARLAAVGADIPLVPGEYGGEPEDGMDWVVAIAPWEPDDPLLAETVAQALAAGLQPYRVTAVASWPGGSGLRQVRLRSLRLGPAESLAP